MNRSLNADQHKDYSKYVSFFNDEMVFMDNAVLSQAAIDIANELESRGRTKDETDDNSLGDINRANFMKSAHEIYEDYAELLSKGEQF